MIGCERRDWMSSEFEEIQSSIAHSFTHTVVQIRTDLTKCKKYTMDVVIVMYAE